MLLPFHPLWFPWRNMRSSYLNPLSWIILHQFCILAQLSDQTLPRPSPLAPLLAICPWPMPKSCPPVTSWPQSNSRIWLKLCLFNPCSPCIAPFPVTAAIVPCVDPTSLLERWKAHFAFRETKRKGLFSAAALNRHVTSQAVSPASLEIILAPCFSMDPTLST